VAPDADVDSSARVNSESWIATIGCITWAKALDIVTERPVTARAPARVNARKKYLFITYSANESTLAEVFKTYREDWAFWPPILPYLWSEIVRNYLLVPYLGIALNRLDSAAKNWVIRKLS
jgi:hypothetical protein